MDISNQFIWLLLGVSVVTIIPRVLPMMLVSRFGMPESFSRFLRHVPIAVMTALLVQAILIEDESMIPFGQNLNVVAFIPTLIAAIWTKSLLVTVVTGILSMMILQLWI